MSLGAHRNDALKVLLCQVVILGVCAAVIANTLAFLLMPLLPALLQDFLPKGFETLLRPGSFLLAGFMGSVGSVLFCVPILINVRDVQPAWLFHETGTMTWTTGRLTLKNWVSYLPGLAAFWGLAIWGWHTGIVWVIATREAPMRAWALEVQTCCLGWLHSTSCTMYAGVSTQQRIISRWQQCDLRVPGK